MQLVSLLVPSFEISTGLTIVGTVVVDTVAPSGGVTILLDTNNTTIDVPNSVVILEGNTSATFDIICNSILSGGTCTVCARYQGQVIRVRLSASAGMGAVYFISEGNQVNTIEGGTALTLHVELTQTATQNVIINLTQSDPSGTGYLVISDLPGSVTITEGAYYIEITIHPRAVSRDLAVLVTGMVGVSYKASQYLYVTPAT